MRRIERGRQKKKKAYRWYNGSWRTGINRYIMECKFFALLLCYSLGDELIDTLWNVNPFSNILLILPSWINRYIMECKFNLCFFLYSSTLWINRYIMECKLCIFWCHLVWSRELIDTLWNVNKISIVLPFGIPPN